MKKAGCFPIGCGAFLLLAAFSALLTIFESESSWTGWLGAIFLIAGGGVLLWRGIMARKSCVESYTASHFSSDKPAANETTYLRERSEKTYILHLTGMWPEFRGIAWNALKKLQARYEFLRTWELKEKMVKGSDIGKAGGACIYELAGLDQVDGIRKDKWIFVEFSQNIDDYLDGSNFDPSFIVHAQKKIPSWGSLLIKESRTYTVHPVTNTEECEKVLFQNLRKIVGELFFEDVPQATTVDVTPSTYRPTHNLENSELHNPTYWNTTWTGSAYELQKKVKLINAQYFQTHTYIKGETDCNDMAVDIWNMLLTEGIRSIIVIGNLDKNAESFAECNHAWIIIPNKGGSYFALEPTNGKCYSKRHIRDNPRLKQYWEGFFYKLPSDLRADIKERW